jgi:hypothetical protein
MNAQLLDDPTDSPLLSAGSLRPLTATTTIITVGVHSASTPQDGHRRQRSSHRNPNMFDERGVDDSPARPATSSSTS